MNFLRVKGSVRSRVGEGRSADLDAIYKSRLEYCLPWRVQVVARRNPRWYRLKGNYEAYKWPKFKIHMQVKLEVGKRN